jgi:3-methylfumaryl-CoA hydratase
MTEQNDDLRQWIGRSEAQTDILHGSHLAGLSALLDDAEQPPSDGTPLAPTAHWLFFQPRAPQSEIGSDGHPMRGGFMPAIELPRRMWAGSRLEYTKPLLVGQSITRTSTITDIVPKQSTAGALIFVTVKHVYEGPDGLALVEDQDIVYRDDPAPNSPGPKPKPAPENSDWHATVQPDEVMLFRYSAVTFNSHRIHYDLPYATTVEGYPGLIVHGPLSATLLIENFRKNTPGAILTSYHYRAVSPLICGEPVTFAGAASSDATSADVWAKNASGNLAMQGKVTWHS